MSRRLPVCCAAALFLAFSMFFAYPANAGLNAGAVARIRWVAPGGLGDPSRSSYGGRPKLVVTVQGVSSFQGADVQILASALDGNALPDAWLGNGTGGCNEGNFTFSVGGSGVAYPNIFNTAPAVGPVLASQNGEMYNRGGCASPPGIGVLWLSAAGPQGQPRNPALEYAVWSVAFDLRGAAQGGPVDCDGDLSDPSGPRPVLLTANFRIPCNGPHQGLGIEVLDANLQTDFLPLVDGTGLLGWQTDSIPPNPDLSPPVVTVISPNGGEFLPGGTFDSLVVNASDNVGPDRMDADLSLDGGANYNIALVHNVPYTPVLLWSVPNTPTGQARVRVTVRDVAGNSGSDVSDANFTIVSNTPPTVSVIYPRGGELIDAGAQVNIVLSGGGVQTGARMDLAYSLDGGATFPGVIALDAPYVTSVLWVTPWVASTTVRVRATVRNPGGLSGQGMSGSNFSLVDRFPPVVQVVSPQGGEVLSGGAPFTAHFTAVDNVAGPLLMSLLYSTDGGATYPGTIATNIPYADAYIWNVPAVATTHARLRITVTDASGNVGLGASGADFTIRLAAPPDTVPPSVAVVEPNGGETYLVGTPAQLRTTASDDRGVVSMDAALSFDGGATYPYVFADHVPYQTPFSWSIPNNPGTQNKVRVTVRDAAGHTSTDASDAVFTIQAPVPDTISPQVTIVAPNGGESFQGGGTGSMQSLASDNIGVTTLDLALSTNSGASYDYGLLQHVTYQPSVLWSVPALSTPNARLRATVYDAAGNSSTDYSDADFSIVASQGGGNQGAIAHAYWIVPGDTASPSRRSDSGQPRLLVTIKGIHNIRGADVQLVLSSADGGLLPEAWQGNPGGCNDGNFTFGLGSVGSRYPSAFNSAPAVPGLFASQDGEFFDTGDCKTLHGAGLFWLSAAGAAGEPRDPTKEYALWNIRVDLRGTAQGGPTDCPGDLGDPAGPRGVRISPNFRIPCNGPQVGAGIAVLDGDLNIDYLPFALGNASLGWEADPSSGLSPVLVADLEAHGAGAGIELTWTIVTPSEVREIEVRRRDSGSDAFTKVATLSPVQGDMRWLDGAAQPFQDHEYVLILRGYGGEEAAIHYKFTGVAETFRLAAPYPNPSRRPVTIRYSMDRVAPMALEVLDVRGTRVRLVQQGQAQPGEHAAEWDGRDEAGRAAPSGVYFLKLSSGDKSTVRRVVRL